MQPLQLFHDSNVIYDREARASDLVVGTTKKYRIQFMCCVFLMICNYEF